MSERKRMKARSALAVLKGTILILLVCLLAGMSVRSAWAEPEYAGMTKRASIEDDAVLLNDAERAQLLEQAAALSEKTGMEIRLLTTEDTEGKSTATYAEDYFESLSEDYNGGCFVVDMDNRQFYIATFGDLQYYLTDDRLDRIISNVQDYAYEGEWAQLLSRMLHDTENYYDKGIADGTTIYNEDTGEYTEYSAPKTVTPLKLLISLAAAIAGFFGVRLSVEGSYGMKHPDRNDYSFNNNVHLNLKRHRDDFVTRHITQHRIRRDDSGGGGGGGSHTSTVHHTSSGHTAGGKGGSF